MSRDVVLCPFPVTDRADEVQILQSPRAMRGSDAFEERTILT